MEPARVRINDHRLMRSSTPPPEDRVSLQRATMGDRSQRRHRVLRERSALHVFVFVLSFIFSAGVATLSILTFVRDSENLLGIVVTGLLSATAFVVLFAWIRTMILEHKKESLTTPEEDDTEHHRTKSVAYGFVALVFAILLAGLIMNTASASPITAG
jgi:hypothetical protein